MSSSSTTKAQNAAPAEFTGLRAILWPIHGYEVKKFLPMGLMMFCILFIYTILRDTKDAIIVNAPGSGAESLAYLKGLGVTFSAILFMVLYTKASNIFKREGLFYVTSLPFLVFFAAFAFIIYPIRHDLHMHHTTISDLQAAYPSLHWVLPLIGNWTYSIFYILSELWGSAVLSLLFWQFANSITPVKEAKRFYGMFAFLGNFGLLASGPAVIFFSSLPERLGVSGEEAWGISLRWLMGLVAFFGIVLLFTFHWMNRNVLTDKRYYDPEAMGEGKKKKVKLGLTDSFKQILQSPYLGLIAVLVLAYGISINLFEGVWKGQMKIAFPNENKYNEMMGYLSTVTGALTITFTLLGSNILRHFSWRIAAAITPVVLMFGATVFFGIVAYNNFQLPEGMKIVDAIKDGVINQSLIVFVAWFGLFVNAFGKAVKYALFDPTKEMAYIPLDPELKTKGKAAVDVIGGRGGKSGGAYIQMGLTTVFAGSALYQLVPIIAPIVLGGVFLWILSVFKLSTKFQALTHSDEVKA